jgi:MFS family permease
MTATTNQNANITAAIVTLACCNLAIGLMTQLIPQVMESQGHSARMIGLNSAIGQLGVFISGLALPLVLKRIPSKTVVVGSIIILMVTLASFAYTNPVYAWYVIRFFNGFGIAALFTLSETWITMAAGTERRARIMGIYTTVLTGTFGAAPFIISLTGFNSSLPWLIGAGCMILGLVAVVAVQATEIETSEAHESFMKVLRKAPVIYICIIATTTFEAMSLTFFTIYGMRNGLDVTTANLIFGVGIAGCMLFFYPIGQLADHWSRGATATLCAVVAIAFAVLTAFTIRHPAIWPITIILRAGAFGVYIVAISSIGDTFKGTELVRAGALIAMCWGVGGIAGPPLAGLIIDSQGINTLPWMMTACYVIVLVALATNGWRMAPAGLDQQAPVAQQP